MKVPRYRKGMRLLGGIGLLAFALAGGPAFAGIQNSLHDLSTGSTSASKSATGTTEICVFCHTPHGSAANTSGPLWNRGASLSAGSYTLYSNGESLDSAVQQPSSSSTACLSCHDGSVAMDILINAPGSGGYTAGGAAAGYTWAAGNTVIDSSTKKMLSTVVANLGSDLSNDHPIGVAYCGGFKSAGGCVDGDFFTTALMKNGSTTGNTSNGSGATDKWWIDTAGGTAGTRDKTDIILFSRNFTQTSPGASGYQPSVECASCHNVHDPSNGTFLRMSNASSALCLACHNK